MTQLNVTDRPQADAILELIRWFDNNSSSVHHALVMAAERNTEDAASVATFGARCAVPGCPNRVLEAWEESVWISQRRRRNS